MVMLSLIVLDPFVISMNPIEVFWLPWPVFLVPPIHHFESMSF